MRPFKEQWKNDLQALKNKWVEANFPNFARDSGEPLRGKWEDQTANGLTRAIVDYLTYIGGNFTRVNTMGTPRKDPRTGKMFWSKSTTQKGTADIVGVYRGKYVAVEVKIGADRQSKDQQAEQKRVESSGGVYIVAKSFEDFIYRFKWYIEHNKL